MSIASFFKLSGKRPREDEEAVMAGGLKPHVRTVACWNANSLINRITYDRSALSGFLRSKAPDAIFISEVRSPALGPANCKKGDGLPRQHGKFSRATPALAKEADTIAAFCREHGYRSHWSLAEYKYAGSALLVRAACAQPHLLRYSLDPEAPADRHHPEGRVILASFGHFDLLGTYSPNNGTTEESFARRRRWDSACVAFLKARGPRPLIWTGDLNVAAEWDDVGPDPSWFRHKNGTDAADAGDRGQPGFTQHEQERFRELLRAGGLVDAYRHVHPQADWQRDSTWRGTPGKDGPLESGRYYNKGMRIDYVLVSSGLVAAVTRVEVLGHGAERVGFLGSDHSPLLAEIAVSELAGEQAQQSATASPPVQPPALP